MLRQGMRGSRLADPVAGESPWRGPSNYTNILG
jgi:hypothetical protein